MNTDMQPNKNRFSIIRTEVSVVITALWMAGLVLFMLHKLATFAMEGWGWTPIAVAMVTIIALIVSARSVR